jgi:endoglucanase
MQHSNKTTLWTVLLLAFVSLSTFAQNRPFPQNVNYGGRGFRTTAISTQTMRDNWANWKSTYLKNCTNNGKRVEFNNPTGTTVSEGQGYGMVMAAYFGDKTTFDALYTYEKSRHNTNGQMGWRSNCSGFYNTYDSNGNVSNSGAVCATDGDMDICHALCIAYAQWGGTYGTEAKNRINSLKNDCYYYNATERKWIGEWRDGSTESYGLSSYWSPGLYRMFKDYTEDSNWDQISTNTYNLIYSARHATTGFTGIHVNVNGTTRKVEMDYNDARSPWRWSLDYLWSGNTDAKNIADKMTDWVKGRGIRNIGDGFKKDGTILSTWNSSPAWVGAWAVGAMTKDQATVNDFVSHFNTCNYEEYYNSSLRILYQLVLTGNYWRPANPSNLRKGVEQTDLMDLYVNEGAVSISPNPAVGTSFKITIPGMGSTAVIQMVDAMGNTVLSRSTNLSTNTVDFNYGKLKAGMYTLKTLRGGKVSTARVMIGKL